MSTLESINEPYLLVTHIPNHRGPDGRRYTDALWLKDLREHFVYLHCLTLAAPLDPADPPPSAVPFDPDTLPPGMRFVDLPRSDTMWRAILNWPRLARALWRAIGEARIVHFGVAEWPMPTGWTITLLTRVRRHPLTVLVIESAFWRDQAGNAGRRGRLRASIVERINRWCVNHVDVPIFTQAQYREELLYDSSRGHVIAASWIDDENVLPPPAIEAAWDRKLAGPMRLLFAARLVEEKGVRVLIDAIRQLRARGGPSIRIDMIGAGPLRDVIEATGREAGTSVDVRMLEPVPYGAPFFDLVAGYDALLIPSVSDEQPRLVYDSFSQGVPVLASATPGIAACVTDGVTGRLVPPRDAAALADLMAWSNANRDALRTMGLAGADVARAFTHREMHAQRWRLLRDRLAARSR